MTSSWSGLTIIDSEVIPKLPPLPIPSVIPVSTVDCWAPLQLIGTEGLLDPGLVTNSILFSFLFVKKHCTWYAWRANLWPLIKGSVLFLPSTPLYRSRTLKGLFELTKLPQSPQPHLKWCLQNFRGSRTMSGKCKDVQGNICKISDTNLECVLVKNRHFLPW